MDMSSVLFETLKPSESASVEQTLRARHLELMRKLLPVNRASSLRKFSDACRAPFRAVADSYLASVHALLRDSPDRCARLLGHWSPGFYLYSLLDRIEPRHLAQAASNLFIPLLFERLANGASPLESKSFTSPTDASGRVLVPTRNLEIRLGPLAQPHSSIHWRCERDRAIVSGADGTPTLELQLPLSPEASGDGIEFIPFEWIKGWEIPHIEHGKGLLLLDEEKPSMEQPSRLASRLERAHALIRELWPEAIPWVKCCLPAFAEIKAQAGLRLTGTFSPGVPSYFCHLEDPFHVAEDVLHEVQHHRFQLLVPYDRFFGKEDQNRFISPFRLDARPLRGLHAGLHAFLAVNELRLRTLRTHGPNEPVLRHALRSHRMNLFVFRTVLAHEALSPAGKDYYEGIRVLLLRHHAALEPMAPLKMVRQVEEELAKHRACVLCAGGELENHEVTFAIAGKGAGL